MKFSKYLKESEEFLSAKFHHDESDPNENRLRDVIERFMKCAEELDQMKKVKFYGKDLPEELKNKRIQTTVHSFTQDDDGSEKLLHAAIGGATESAELLKAVYDHKWGDVEFDEVNCLEEMGDKAWYDAIIWRMFNFKLENIFERNIAKLLKRYKKGKFSKDEALNRDLDTERKTLEEGFGEHA